MKKIILFLTLISVIEIQSDLVTDNFSDLVRCVDADANQCSSVSLKTKGLECCRVKETDFYDNSKYEEDEGCLTFFTKYVSQSMMRQIEIISIEDLGILKAYYPDLEIPRTNFEITCSSTSAIYELGKYNYSSEDLQKLKSHNHCLYYYYSSIQRNLFSQNPISITKDLCINAESLDITKNEDIYCAYTEVAILYSDNTKTEFKTCYFLPSESINSKQLDPTTEAALQGISDNQAQKSGKTVAEYDAKLIDKNGRTLKYNSIEGVSASSFLIVNFSKIILLGFFLLI